MRVNKQSNIKIPKAGFKRSRFNWSHDVNTTFNWGEIQPTQCKLLIPGSKTTMSSQNLIRLAPMVAPTFGRVKYKTFNQFVGMSEIAPNFAAMMAQEPVTRNGSTFVPKEVPSVLLGQLSMYVLFGAKATLYWINPTKTQSQIDADLARGRYTTSFRKPKSDGSAWVQDLLVSNILNAVSDTTNGCFQNVTTGIARSNTTILPDVPNVGSRIAMYPLNMNNAALRDGVWSGDGVHTPVKTDYQICLGGSNVGQLIPVDKSVVADPNSSNPLIAAMNAFDTQVTMEGADYMIEFQVPFATGTGGVVNCALAFELSDYGKRIRKVLQGCGYQINFASTARVSILPLLAQYKAYFDVFGLTLYKGWETTTCARLIDYIKNNNVTSVDPNRYTNVNQQMAVLPTSNTNLAYSKNQYFVNFMLGEVANEWYTENADFIGAHLPQLAVSPKSDPFGFISVDTNGAIDFGANVANASGNNTDGTSQGQDANQGSNAWALGLGANNEVHAFINQVQHGQVDAELLKRMYRWTNRNTILGREIAKLLRAQGLGKFVDECKSNYIGSTDDMITISDVTSLAATSDASLGEFGGKGIQYMESNTLVFENDEFGYWVTLATVIPEAGYTQGIDPTLKVLDKMNFYNPDFDALGMEITEKDTIVGNSYVGYNIAYNRNPAYVSFGFIPRYSKFKVCQNLVNGDFNRHNKRDIYLPYTLDKQINLNDFESTKFTYTQRTGEDPMDSSDWSTEEVFVKKSHTAEHLPVACNVYRQPTKYEWLGNFNRIFRDNPTANEWKGIESDITGAGDFKVLPGFDDFDEDNFMSHGIYNVQCYAPMKPINESYGLEDDDPDKAGAEFVQKA